MKQTIVLAPLRLLALLPLSVLYVLSDAVACLLYHVVRYRRHTVDDNLRRSLPHLSDSQRRRVARRFYRHLADVVVETVKLLHISDRQLQRRIEVRNAELIDQAAAHGQSTLLYLGHYANWEWVQAITFHCTLPELRGEVYRPLHDSNFDKLLLTIRSRFFPNQLIPQARVARTLLSTHQSGKTFCIGLISDQRPHIEHPSHTMQFLSQETGFITGGEEIGNRVGAQFLYIDIEKTRRGHYRLTLQPIEPSHTQTDYPISEQFMKMLEQSILRQPELWLWSHKRWLHQQQSSTHKP